MNTKFKTLTNMALALLLAVVVSSCLKDDVEPKTYSAAEEKSLREAYLQDLIDEDYDIDTTASGIYYVVLDEGEGEYAQPGDSLTVGYAGYLIGGTMFDATAYHNAEGKYGFVLGRDSMIVGWNEGMQLMNEGSRLQLIIPSELAYGEKGHLSIPPYQTLIFVVKLFDINPLEESN